MQTITLKIPGSKKGDAAFDYATYLAAKLYEDAELTAGQAAQVAMISKRSFIELMGKYGVSPFSKQINDLTNDIANA